MTTSMIVKMFCQNTQNSIPGALKDFPGAHGPGNSNCARYPAVGTKSLVLLKNRITKYG